MATLSGWPFLSGSCRNRPEMVASGEPHQLSVGDQHFPADLSSPKLLAR